MLEESELYRKLVDASTDGLWLLDADGKTLMANPRMAELLGRTPEEMASLSAYDVHDEQGKQEFAAHMAAAAAGDPGHNDLETMYVRADGTPIWLLASYRPIHADDGSTVGYLHRYSDHTEQRDLLQAHERRERLLGTAERIAQMGSWSSDLDAGTTRWSNGMHRVYGIPEGQAPPTSDAFMQLIHPEDRPMVEAVASSLASGEDRFDWTARVVRPDGDIRWIHSQGHCERDRSGRMVRLTGADRDVTGQVMADHELAEASRRLSLLRDVAEVANKSTVLSEALVQTARVIDQTPGWHMAWAVMADRPEEAVSLMSDPEVGPVTTAPDLVAETFRTGEVGARPLPGRETSHTLVAIPIRHTEDVVCVVLAVGAESPPDDHSRDLISQVAAMLGRVAERERAAAELAEARDQAMEASRLKSEFLATMSHEIRTPMNGVIGLTDLLMRTPLDPQQRRLAEALHGAGSTLRGIINDILDLSKIEAGKLELEVVDFEVRAVVEQTVRLLRSSASQKGLDLRLTVAPRVPTYVRGDAVRWEQILTNLGSNAIKFTDRGSVHVAVDLASRTPDGVLLEVVVQDTGPGIPLAAQQRLFDAFTQADPSTTRRHGGTGLGLTIAKQLVDAMEGELTLVSEVGQGTTFRFTARLGNAAEDARQPAAETLGTAPTGAHVQRVLIVEDNQVNQMVAVGLLESVGFATSVVEDGVEAVEALQEGHGYAAVLMDCRMPRMDGYTATRAIRAQEGAGERVPIIAMTASALEGERERCLESGMDDFLTKPVDSARLHKTLRRWIYGPDAEDDDGGRTPVAAPAPAPAPVAEAPAAPPIEGQVVDVTRIDMLHEMVKDGVSLFQRSSGNFIAHAQDHLTAIGTAVEKADADELMATAHKLKGSALNLGLPRVGAAALELEERGRENRLDGTSTAYSVLTREIGLALAALEQERAVRA